MTTRARKAVDEYLGLEYPFRVDADPVGGYVISFPDLPGCMTQVESLEEIASAADEVRRLWIETEYEAGESIPLPSFTDEYSGRFNVRLPKSLHRRLANSAQQEGVSLNQLVVSLLSRNEASSVRQGSPVLPLSYRRVYARRLRPRVEHLVYSLAREAGEGEPDSEKVRHIVTAIQAVTTHRAVVWGGDPQESGLAATIEALRYLEELHHPSGDRQGSHVRA